MQKRMFLEEVKRRIFAYLMKTRPKKVRTMDLWRQAMGSACCYHTCLNAVHLLCEDHILEKSWRNGGRNTFYWVNLPK